MTPKTTVTAIHEAGHAVVSLATPLRKHIESAKIWTVESEWRGEVRMDGGDRRKVDPAGVFEVAKGMGGPMAQLEFCPDSMPEELQKLIGQAGGLLKATQVVVEEGQGIESNWWLDLQAWINVCKVSASFPNHNFFALEKAIATFLNRV